MIDKVISRLGRGVRMLRMTAALTIRCIRQDTRMLRTHLFRLLLLLFVGWMLLTVEWEMQWLGAPGLEFFMRVSWLNFVFVSLGGVGYFSMAVTEEKEDMTLGLLRMADVGPLALLLGKWVPRLFGAVVLLSIQFPFTMLTITLGGVTLEQVSAAYAALLTYTLLLSTVALFWSVACRTSGNAAFWTAAVILAFLFLPWWFYRGAGIAYSGAFGLAVEELLARVYEASPVYRLGRIMATGFVGRAFGYQAIGNTVAAAALFLLSWATFELFNRDERPPAPARGLVSRSTARLRRLGGGRVWQNALFWKDFHFIAGGPLAIVLKLVLYGLLAVALAFSIPSLSWRATFSWDEFGRWLMGTALVAFLVEGAVLAARIFEQETKWNTLQSIMILPLSTPAIAYSKVAGAAFGLIPSAAWFAVGALFAPGSLADALEEIFREGGFWWLATYYLLLLHLCAFMSLFIKWAALPVSFGLVIFTNACCGWLLAETDPGSETAYFAIMSILGWVAIAILHVAIGYRLNEVAASG